jgi:hypothetical protein
VLLEEGLLGYYNGLGTRMRRQGIYTEYWWGNF